MKQTKRKWVCFTCGYRTDVLLRIRKHIWRNAGHGYGADEKAVRVL